MNERKKIIDRDIATDIQVFSNGISYLVKNGDRLYAFKEISDFYENCADVIMNKELRELEECKLNLIMSHKEAEFSGDTSSIIYTSRNGCIVLETMDVLGRYTYRVFVSTEDYQFFREDARTEMQYYIATKERICERNNMAEGIMTICMDKKYDKKKARLYEAYVEYMNRRDIMRKYGYANDELPLFDEEYFRGIER